MGASATFIWVGAMKYVLEGVGGEAELLLNN